MTATLTAPATTPTYTLTEQGFRRYVILQNDGTTVKDANAYTRFFSTRSSARKAIARLKGTARS